jgi:hypothetical protein
MSASREAPQLSFHVVNTCYSYLNLNTLTRLYTKVNNDPQIIYGPILKSPSTENTVQSKPIIRHSFQYCLFISHNVTRNIRTNAEPYFTNNMPLWYSPVSAPKWLISNNPMNVIQIAPAIPSNNPRKPVSFISFILPLLINIFRRRIKLTSQYFNNKKT